MRKFSIILLSIIYFCSQLITVAWVNSRPVIHGISHLIYELSNKEGGIEISISVDQYKLLKDDDEIRWQGKLYDIEEKSFHGNLVTLKIVNDEFETSLLNTHEKVQKKMSQHYPDDYTVVMIWKWLQHTYIGNENIPNCGPNNVNAKVQIDHFKYSLSSGNSFIIPRPPKA
jgi:hypothetical protein